MTGFGCGVSVAFQAETHTVCPMFAATGWYCPACGATRACQAIASGDLHRALIDNLALVLGLLILCLRTGAVLVGRPQLAARVDRAAGAVSIPSWAVLILAWTVVRNLPLASGILRPA
jgi:hypothetical protein